MKACRYKKGERGFTLVEVLIAMTILAIGLLAIADMQVTAMSARTFSHNISTVDSLASGVLEDILSWDVKDPRLTIDGTFDWDFDQTTKTVVDPVTIAGAGTYTATYSINADAPDLKITTITVTVRGGTAVGFLSGMGQRQRTLIGLKRIE
jgi:type IV pilus assembly protein PilV